MNDQSDTLNLLKEKIQEADSLKIDHSDSKLTQWKTEVNMILDKLIGDQSKYFEQFNKVHYTPGVVSFESGDEVFHEAYDQGLEKAKGILNSIIFGVEHKLI